MKKGLLLWIFAFILTVSAAYYQRLTGPTYPLSNQVTLEDRTIDFSLIRSYAKPNDAPVKIKVEDKEVTGFFWYKRFPSHDTWNMMPLVREDDHLVAYIPQQPPAGKVQYQISLEKDQHQVQLTETPVTIRFRGDVPAIVMIPHIILMFAAMLLSTRAGMAAIFKEKTRLLTILTIITLFLGGIILGPMVQKFAFGVYWAGWPLGTDLTDNKTAVAFLFWIVALFMAIKNPRHRTWVLAASLVLLLIYLIPHSLLGSEIDFTQEVTISANR